MDEKLDIGLIVEVEQAFQARAAIAQGICVAIR